MIKTQKSVRTSEIVWPERVSPLVHAVGLVDCDEPDGGLLKKLYEGVVVEALGGDIAAMIDVQLAPTFRLL